MNGSFRVLATESEVVACCALREPANEGSGCLQGSNRGNQGRSKIN